MKKSTQYITLLILVCSLCACAFRNMPVENKSAAEHKPTAKHKPIVGNKFDKFTNLYSRNFIVAAPTAAANAICAPAGAVGMLALFAYVGGSAGGGDAVADLMYVGGLLGGGACGMIVGAPFIPLSYICDENPWYLTKGTGFKTNWACHS